MAEWWLTDRWKRIDMAKQWLRKNGSVLRYFSEIPYSRAGKP